MFPDQNTTTGFGLIVLALAISAIPRKKCPTPSWVYDIIFFLISLALLMIIVGVHGDRV